MSRTTTTDVKSVLMEDYDTIDNPSLTPFIDTASAFVDQVVVCATRKGITLDDTLLELIERWLAAHCYSMSDQPYSSRSNLRASGSFQGQTGKYFEATKYGQTAVSLDHSGCLAALGEERKVARGRWLGRPPSEQTPYDQRD